ncbi:MAG: zinc ribbon domain-containing protein [Candidatus Hermodarchaeota archaeon]
MEINTLRLANLANKRFKDIVNDGFKLFIKIYGKIILPLAIFQIILIILDVFLLTDFRYYISTLETNYSSIMDKLYDGLTLTASEWNFLGFFLILSYILIFLQNLIGAIIISIAMCSVSTYVYRKFIKDEISFMEALKSSLNKKLFLVILILGICLPISSLLLFIPAIIIFVFFIFLVFTFNMELKKNPILEARAISKGGFWKIIGVFVINVLLISFISYIFNLIFGMILTIESASFTIAYYSWYEPLTRNYGMIILYEILVNFADIIFAPLFICLLTSVFSSFKAKRDLIDLHQQGYYTTREPYRESFPLRKELYDEAETEYSIPPTIIKEKYYCPFCGHFISQPEKFCPKCGENLSFINK